MPARGWVGVGLQPWLISCSSRSCPRCRLAASELLRRLTAQQSSMDHRRHACRVGRSLASNLHKTPVVVHSISQSFWELLCQIDWHKTLGSKLYVQVHHKPCRSHGDLTLKVKVALLGHSLVKLLLEAAHLASRLGDGVLLGLVQAGKVSIPQLGCCQLLPHLKSWGTL